MGTMINKKDGAVLNLTFRVFLLYAFINAGNALFGIFLPLYFDSIGFSLSVIGVLAALRMGSGMLSQLFLGPLADRLRYKNTMLFVVVFFSTLTLAFFQLSTYILFVAAAVIIFSALHAPIVGLAEAMALEYSENRSHKMRYTWARTGGAIGFAFTAIIAGYFLSERINSIFGIYIGLGLALCILMLFLPKVKGHQYGKKEKVPVKVLLQYKPLIAVVLLTCILRFGDSFFMTYTPLFMQIELDAPTYLVDLIMSVAAICEVPVLLMMRKLSIKFELKTLLLACIAITGIRWILVSLVPSPWLLLALQPMHSVILFAAVLTSIYISRSVADELKASGQIYFMLLSTVAGMLAGFSGGIMIDALSFRFAYLILGLTTLMCVFIWKFGLFRRFPPDKDMSGI